MKLNLGSGDKVKPGYVNVDIRPEGHPDIVADIRTVAFPGNQFDEILMFDLIEHVSYVEGKALLRRCSEWLAPNGVLLLHTGNMAYCALCLAEGEDREAMRWVFGTLGEGETNYLYGYHRWGYSKASITNTLEQVGLEVLYAEADCDGYGLRVTAVKRET